MKKWNTLEMNESLPFFTNGTYSKDYGIFMQKLQRVKAQLAENPLKKTGFNKFKNYSYFELEDFTNCVITLLEKEGLASRFFFHENIGYLIIMDTARGTWERWETPIRRIDSQEYPKGDIGKLMKDEQAYQTYARRALYLQALELTETNSIELEKSDTKIVKEKKKPAKTTKKVTTSTGTDKSKMIMDKNNFDVGEAIKRVEMKLDAEGTVKTDILILKEFRKMKNNGVISGKQYHEVYNEIKGKN